MKRYTRRDIDITIFARTKKGNTAKTWGRIAKSFPCEVVRTPEGGREEGCENDDMKDTRYRAKRSGLMIPADAENTIDGRSKVGKAAKENSVVSQPLIRKAPFLNMTDLYTNT